MKILPYIGKYRPKLTQIALDRGLGTGVINELPDFGLVALDEDDTIICAGFLRRLENTTHTVLLDSLITDPLKPYNLRDTAQDRLVSKLIKIASSNNIRTILAFTMIKSTLLRSQRHGFVQLSHNVISLAL